MIKVLKCILTPKQCNSIISFCEQHIGSTEKIETFIGNTYGRYYQNPRGWFRVFRMTREECKEYCNQIENFLPGFKVVSFRPMLYEEGNWLRNHLDSPTNDHEGASTNSLNIMLSEKGSFTGGSFLIGNEQRQIIDLDQGDAILYDYDQMHEVKKIKSGRRWIINVRVTTV